MSTEPICPRPSFLAGFVGHSQMSSVRREGPNSVHWPLSKKFMPTKAIDDDDCYKISALYSLRQGSPGQW